MAKIFTKLNVGDTVATSGTRVFKKLTTATDYGDAGLYDANNNLVASWDTLVNTYGMDVEKDYTSSTYETDTACPYYVLTNNSELANGVKIVLGDVSYIGNYAFSSCINLVSIIATDGVTVIGQMAFAECQKLKTFSIPDSVTILSSDAFAQCIGLLNVNIGKGLSSIALGIYDNIGTFDGCDSLSGIWVDEQNQYYSSDKQGVLYDKNKTALMKAPAQIIGRCDIPSSVTNIYPYAFAYCTRLTDVTISGTPSIKNCAFRDCTGLAQISLGSSVSIGTAAFYNCSSLTELTIPDTITSIEPKAFSGCASIKTMVIPDSATGSFSSGKGEFDVTERNEELFENCTSLVSVTLGKGIWIITNSTFNGCTSLATVNLPDNIQDIYKNAFADCPNLQYAFYGNNDKYLGNESNPYLALISLTDKTLTNYNIHADTKLLAQGSFDGCTATNITIPDGIMRIDESLFRGCTAMVSIILPATIVFIGWLAFDGCKNLKNVYYRGTEEQWGSINLRDGNNYLTDAIIYYNYVD